jgi:hypothetical protein
VELVVVVVLDHHRPVSARDLEQRHPPRRGKDGRRRELVVRGEVDRPERALLGE